MKIEHIGIAVKDMEASNQLFEKLLGKPHYKTEKVESEHVDTSFFQLGDSKIELLYATQSDSAIAKFIEKKGEGIHHIAFAVEEIVKEVERLKGARDFSRFRINRNGGLIINWFSFFSSQKLRMGCWWSCARKF